MYLMHPKKIQIKNFDYDLPESKIAKYPLTERDSGKLLVYKDGIISEDVYRNIDSYFSEKSFLVFNKTKVIQARLNFINSTGAKIEIFCLEPGGKNAEPASAMMRKKSVEWECMIGRVAKWKEKVISLKTKNFDLNAEILKKNGSTYNVIFSWQPEDLTFAEILEQAGEMPIPPYLKRKSEEIDLSRYQTVYAGQKGSVAAPTAGLHFTQQIFEKFKSKKISTDYVTLHVSAGTFQPVKSETIEGHDMHSEWIEVDKVSIEKILKQFSVKQKSNSIVAVGTTSLRTIESLYWMGVKTNLNSDYSLPELEIKQWDAYELPQNIDTTDSLKSLLAWLKKNEMEKLLCKTQIFIAPDYKLRIANALVTNFHQPCSTLLLLVAAVVGDDWKKIYKHALENNFRFLSYGDGSLLFKNNIEDEN